MIKNLSKFLHQTNGASAVEFALVMPLVIGLGLGAFETGLAMYERSELNEAAVAGTRAVALYGDDEAQIMLAARQHLPDNLKEVAEISISDETFGGHPFKRVSVQYDHDLMINFTTVFDSFPLSASRLAPVMPRMASTGGPGTGSGPGPGPASPPSNCNASAGATINASATGANTSITYSGSASACGQTNTTGGTTSGPSTNVNTGVFAGNP